MELEIQPYENATGYVAHLINGYIINNDGNTAVIGFEVSYGEPWPNGPLPQFNYPTVDQQYCLAQIHLQNGINSELQLNNTFAAGLNTLNVNLSHHSLDPYYQGRIWRELTSTGMFDANDYQTYHNGGLESIDHYLLTSCNPSSNPPAVCPEPVQILMNCGVVLPPVFPNPDHYHWIQKITTASYIASY